MGMCKQGPNMGTRVMLFYIFVEEASLVSLFLFVEEGWFEVGITLVVVPFIH